LFLVIGDDIALIALDAVRDQELVEGAEHQVAALPVLLPAAP
jgi:hypothetical protein